MSCTLKIFFDAGFLVVQTAGEGRVSTLHFWLKSPIQDNHILHVSRTYRAPKEHLKSTYIALLLDMGVLGLWLGQTQ